MTESSVWHASSEYELSTLGAQLMTGEGVGELSFASAGMPSSGGVAGATVLGAFALAWALPAIIVLALERSGAARHSADAGERWSEVHGVVMLAATLAALALHWPALTTLGGVASLAVLVVRHRRVWTASGRFGVANWVTTLRLLLTLGMVAAVGHGSSWLLAAIALTILLLDALDGRLARRFGGEGAFGARYDMESDALFVLSLSYVLFSRGVGGSWVLLAGLWRYLFVVVPLLIPSRGGEAPRSLLYRSAYSVMVGSFLLALVAPSGVARALAALGTFVLSASFLRSFWYRYLPPSTP